MNRTDTCFSKGDATPRQEAEQRPCAAPSAAAASNPTGPDSQLSRMLHAPLATRILGLDVWVRAYACVVRGRGRLAKKIDSGVFNPRIFPKKGVPAEPDIQNLLEIVLECLMSDDDDRDKGLAYIYLGLMSFSDDHFRGVGR